MVSRSRLFLLDLVLEHEAFWLWGVVSPSNSTAFIVFGFFFPAWRYFKKYPSTITKKYLVLHCLCELLRAGAHETVWSFVLTLTLNSRTSCFPSPGLPCWERSYKRWLTEALCLCGGALPISSTRISHIKDYSECYTCINFITITLWVRHIFIFSI